MKEDSNRFWELSTDGLNWKPTSHRFVDEHHAAEWARQMGLTVRETPKPQGVGRVLRWLRLLP